jgi:integrase
LAQKTTKQLKLSFPNAHCTEEQIKFAKSFIKGFYVAALANGAVSYRILSQPSKGKRRNLVIGNSNSLSVEQALRKGIEMDAALSAGVNPKASKQSFDTFAQNFLEDIKTKSIKKYHEFKNRYSAVPESLRQKPIQELGALEIKTFLDDYQERNNLKNSSRNRTRSFISVVCAYAVEQGAISDNPCKKVKILAEKNIRTNTIPTELIKYYVSFLLKEGNWLAAFSLIIMVVTGIRCGNVLSMTLDMISPCLSYIHLPNTKSGKPLTVSVAELLKPLLQELIDHAKQKKSRFLFPSNSTSTGHISSPRGPHERAIAAVNAGGFNVVCTIHDLRRTFANQLLRASGGNVYLVSQALGHGSVAVTMRYLSIRSDELDEAVNLAAAALGLESLAA